MNQKKKPFVFIVLCVLSMAGGVFGVLLSVLEMIDKELLAFATYIPGYTSVKAIAMNVHFLYPVAKFILYSLSFFGALTMFRQRKRGFYLYSIAQLLLLVIPYLFWNLSALEIFFTDLPDFVFTIAFIGAYALYLPIMTQAVVSEEMGTEK